MIRSAFRQMLPVPTFVLVPALALVTGCGGGGGGGGNPAFEPPRFEWQFVPSATQSTCSQLTLSLRLLDTQLVATADVLLDEDGLLATTADQFVALQGIAETPGASFVVTPQASWSGRTFQVFAVARNAKKKVTVKAPVPVTFAAAPTVSWLEPSANASAARGGRLTLEVQASDPDSVAEVNLYAIAQLGGASYPLAEGLAEADGTSLTVEATLAGIPAGVYSLVAEALDDGCVVEATNVATLDIVDVGNVHGVGSSAADFGSLIAGHLDGALVWSGAFDASLPFELSQTAGRTLPHTGGASGRDAFVARFDSSLAGLQWVHQISGFTSSGSTTGPQGVVAQSDGSTVVVGRFTDDLVFNFGETLQIPMALVGNRDGFLARYDDSGVVTSLVRVGGLAGGGGGSNSVFVSMSSLAVAPDDSLAVAGYYSRNATFGIGEPNQVALLDNSKPNGFLARFAPDLSLAWVVDLQTNTNAQANDVCFADDGSLYVCGGFMGSLSFHSAGSTAIEQVLNATADFDVFVAKYDGQGAFQWARRVGNTGFDMARACELTPAGHLLVAGDFSSSVDFGAANILTSHGGVDGFVACFSSSGTFLNGWAVGSASDDTLGRGIVRTNSGSLLVTGRFAGHVDFDDDGHTDALWLGSNDACALMLGTDANGLRGLNWFTTVASSGDDSLGDAFERADGSFVIGGAYANQARFGNVDDPEALIVGANGSTDACFVRLNADGKF
ncbi:MAG: hypothetical protein IT454_15715 [Planctomycetes bacterium]|nr:hypothetical protein [Planctomycetota bacterium]